MKGVRVIPLTKGMVAIISACDYRRVNRHKWHTHTSRGTKRKPGYPYARATINGKKVYLQRFIMEAPEYMDVDHGNHQTLDCRRENLEVIPPEENLKRRRKRGKKQAPARLDAASRTKLVPLHGGGPGDADTIRA